MYLHVDHYIVFMKSKKHFSTNLDNMTLLIFQDEGSKSPPPSPAIDNNGPPKISYASIVAKAKAKKETDSNSGSEKTADDNSSSPATERKDQSPTRKQTTEGNRNNGHNGPQRRPGGQQRDRDSRGSQGEFRQVNSRREREGYGPRGNGDRREGARPGPQRDYDRPGPRK